MISQVTHKSWILCTWAHSFWRVLRWQRKKARVAQHRFNSAPSSSLEHALLGRSTSPSQFSASRWRCGGSPLCTTRRGWGPTDRSLARRTFRRRGWTGRGIPWRPRSRIDGTRWIRHSNPTVSKNKLQSVSHLRRCVVRCTEHDAIYWHTCGTSSVPLVVGHVGVIVGLGKVVHV